MSTSFGTAHNAPDYMATEPQKAQNPEIAIQPGLDGRVFTDEELKHAFFTFDIDQNQFVGPAEIRYFLDLMGERASDEVIDEMIRMCDVDGSGQVSFENFHRMMSAPPPPLPPTLPVIQRVLPLSRATLRAKYMSLAEESINMQKALHMQGDDEEEEPTQKASKVKPALVEDANFRAASIDSLVYKLSGGAGKIKPSQVKKVYQRFKAIDSDNSGSIEYKEFVQALEMPDNQISKQMFKIFDMDGSGSIEVKEFIIVLSRYTTAAKAEKLKFAFMMFDEDSSGLIERSELLSMLAASFAIERYTSDELEERVDKVYDYLNIPRDSSISYENFLKLADNNHGLIFPVEQRSHTMSGKPIQTALDEKGLTAGL